MCFQRQMRCYRELTRKYYKQFEMMYTIEFYSRKRLGRRRQYYWRARHWNGNIVAIGGEGYYNSKDRDDSFYRFRAGMQDGKFEVRDEDS